MEGEIAIIPPHCTNKAAALDPERTKSSSQGRPKHQGPVIRPADVHDAPAIHTCVVPTHNRAQALHKHLDSRHLLYVVTLRKNTIYNQYGRKQDRKEKKRERHTQRKDDDIMILENSMETISHQLLNYWTLLHY